MISAEWTFGFMVAPKAWPAVITDDTKPPAPAGSQSCSMPLAARHRSLCAPGAVRLPSLAPSPTPHHAFRSRHRRHRRRNLATDAADADATPPTPPTPGGRQHQCSSRDHWHAVEPLNASIASRQAALSSAAPHAICIGVYSAHDVPPGVPQAPLPVGPHHEVGTAAQTKPDSGGVTITLWRATRW